MSGGLQPNRVPYVCESAIATGLKFGIGDVECNGQTVERVIIQLEHPLINLVYLLSGYEQLSQIIDQLVFLRNDKWPGGQPAEDPK